jgi:hypothetical protein
MAHDSHSIHRDDAAEVMLLESSGVGVLKHIAKPIADIRCITRQSVFARDICTHSIGQTRCLRDNGVCIGSQQRQTQLIRQALSNRKSYYTKSVRLQTIRMR